jgi:hypothetical protein
MENTSNEARQNSSKSKMENEFENEKHFVENKMEEEAWGVGEDSGKYVKYVAIGCASVLVLGAIAATTIYFMCYHH